MSEEYGRKGFVYEWRIENFKFCWHKTGEYLESPLFHTEPSRETSWRLWLYPRGEDDGEYISCYLFRAEGGPEVVDVDFELCVSVGRSLVKPPISFEKIYSLKIGQKEGEKSFVRRREIFSHHVAWKEYLTLVLSCTIFNRKGDMFEGKKHFGRTTISFENISGVQVFDIGACIDPKNNQDIEIKAPMEVDPLISINLLYFNESIVIKIDPKNCEKIKYADCKITVIKNWEKKLPIQHCRYWIGEIKTDNWRYDAPFPKTDANQGVEICAQKTLFLYYHFAYSVGSEYSNNEMNDYGTDLWIEDYSSLEPPIRIVKTEKPSEYLTAAKALELEYTSQIFSDVIIKTKNTTFNANKAVMRARSSKLNDMLKDNPESIEILDYTDEIIRRFLGFLYTDNVDGLHWPIAVELSVMAAKYNVELLKKKCISFLKKNLQAKNASDLLIVAESSDDPSLRTYVQKYIMEHDEEVFNTDEWYIFTESHWKLAEKCMLLKYQKNM